jgi:hypothetical protein
VPFFFIDQDFGAALAIAHVVLGQVDSNAHEPGTKVGIRR